MGGKIDWQNSAKISEFRSGSWRYVQDLIFARQSSTAIKFGSQFLIFGGTATSAL